MLSFFLEIMKQKCGNYVTVQLLQTLNILFENIRHETSLYYLLSNNHVNSIITHKFDLSDEEVMAYYISFLKTLSFKLNTHTIHFFFNTSDFPLYTEAIKYFNHPEKMVRIAVRILTLNVFKVDEKSMLKFITGQTVPCLSDLVHFIKNNVVNIEKCIRESSNLMMATSPTSQTNSGDDATKTQRHTTNNSVKTQPQSPSRSPTGDIDSLQLRRGSVGKAINSTLTTHNNSGNNVGHAYDKLMLKIDDLFAEHLDHLHYLNDVLMLKIDDIIRILSENLMHHLIKPLIDAYKDDPHSSMIRLFTLEFTTGILSRVLATSLHENICDDDEENDLKNVSSNEIKNRSATDVKDCDDDESLSNDKLTGTQLAIIEQSKEIAEMKVKTLLKTDTQQQMTYLSLFDSEYNDMKKKRMTIDYLLMDASMGTIPGRYTRYYNQEQKSNSASKDRNNAISKQEKLDLDSTRYQIRDFLLWRQLLLNVKNEKDRELSLKNTSWLSYAKLLQWLE